MSAMVRRAAVSPPIAPRHAGTPPETLPPAAAPGVPADEMPMNATSPASHVAPPHAAPVAHARYLVLIEQDGAMLARLFDERLQTVEEFDGATEEVAVMIAGLRDQGGADSAAWDRALGGHGARERTEARVYVLDV